MDDELKEYFVKLENSIKDLREQTSNDINNLREQTSNDINNLREQTMINCSKLDKMDAKLDSIVEIVTANGQGIEVISQRVDKLEK